MEEFEKLEVELRALYDDYLQKFRYLAYLEHLYEDAAKAEQERFERRYCIRDNYGNERPYKCDTINCYRQAATKKQLEQMRAEDTSFESMMEGNDSIFVTNLQEPLVTPLTNPETTTVEKSGQSARVKPGTDHFILQYNSGDIKENIKKREFQWRMETIG